jgi:hypothetical protein
MRLDVRIMRFLLVIALLLISMPAPAQVCGDGVIDPGETCDPPDLTIDPANGQPKCRTDCTSCGDGVVQGDDSETCDIGRDAICSWCQPNCNERIFPGSGYGGCTCGDDIPALAALRADILASCECATASSRSAFLRCARPKMAAIPEVLLLPPCRVSTLKCLAHSACGKPGAVTCCRTTANGKGRCVVKPDAAHCTAPKGGSASLGVSENCCDACP